MAVARYRMICLVLLAITFKPEEIGLSYCTCAFLVTRDISHGAIIFDLVTLKFDLLLKNFNLCQNFQTRRDRALILHMCIPCDKMVPQCLTL